MRQCDGCQECCNGNLKINVFGYEVFKGNPCKFMCDAGCSIYKKRPEPCRFFNCLWKMDESIPEDLYPKNSGIVIMYKNLDGCTFVVVEEFWGKLSETQQNNVLKWMKKRQKNGVIIKEKETIYIGHGDKKEMEYLTSRKFGFE
jgi:hypothetical protein